MSIVFYGYKLKKEDLWETLKEIKKFYFENHLIKKASESWFKEGAKEEKMDLLQKKRDFLDKLNNRGESETVDIQLFELEDGNYLFRVLERGYLFLNNAEKQNWKIEACFYDDRDEMNESWIKNLNYAEFVDQKIQKREYFLYPIVDYSDILNWLYDAI